MTFTAQEFKRLTSTPRVGPTVVRRLEQIGVNSLADLRQLGVDLAIARICGQIGNPAWANRRRALRAVLDDNDAGGAPHRA